MEALAADCLQQFRSSGHDGGFVHGVEAAGFGLVDGVYLLVRGVASPLAAGKQVDGAAARAPFVHVNVFAGEVEPILPGGSGPGHYVVGHGVVEHAVHVKKHGFERAALKAVPVQIMLYFGVTHYYYRFSLSRMALLSFS